MTNWREPTYSKAAERFRGKSKDYTLEGDINPQPKLDDIIGGHGFFHENKAHIFFRREELNSPFLIREFNF